MCFNLCGLVLAAKAVNIINGDTPRRKNEETISKSFSSCIVARDDIIVVRMQAKRPSRRESNDSFL